MLLMLLSCPLVFTQCGKKGGTKRIETVTEPSEPQFEKEGVLTFFNEDDSVKTIDIEIADNNRERAQGMMYRSSMDYNKGMLFVFDYEELQSFWMKNTKMSLDIIYVNANMEIVSIYKHTPPYSETNIPSMKPAMYVVETAAGFCDRFDVKEGQVIQFAQDTDPS